MKRSLFIALCITILFSYHTVNAMQALRKKQEQVAQDEAKMAKIKRAAAFRTCTLEQIFLLPQDTQTQEGITCGPRSIFLAAAIDDLMANQKKLITPNDISTTLDSLTLRAEIGTTFADAMVHCQQFGMLTNDSFNIFLVGHNLLVNHLFVLGFSGQEIVPISQKPVESQKTLEEAQEYITDIPALLTSLREPLYKHTLTTPIHFICNLGLHWVLFSVWYKQDTIMLYYIDPMNTPINHFKQPFLDYICDNLELKCPIIPV